MAFSSYCGLAILHSLMYKKVADAQYRSKLSNELMMYHMKVPEDEVTSLVATALPSTGDYHPSFGSFTFSPRTLPMAQSTAAVFSIFSELGMIQRWRIDKHSLGRFLLMVRRGYRDPPYHNWAHAYSVAHFAFLLLSHLNLVQAGVISELEAFALVIACLCHDLDHRGTNNTFQISSNSVLAALYSSEGSVMERHHFAQSMCILNTEGCNILDNLGKADYTRCLDLIRDNILLTKLIQKILDLISEVLVLALDNVELFKSLILSSLQPEEFRGVVAALILGGGDLGRHIRGLGLPFTQNLVKVLASLLSDQGSGMHPLVLHCEVIKLRVHPGLGLLSVGHLGGEHINQFLALHNLGLELVAGSLKLLNAAHALSLEARLPELDLSLGLGESLQGI